MKKWSLFSLALILSMTLGASQAQAERVFSVDVGYVDAGSAKYGNGLVYGLAIFEGTGKIGFAVATRTFSNSISYDVSVKSGSDFLIFEYEEVFSDFCISIMPTYNIWFGGQANHLILAAGPQVHFIRAEKFYMTEGYSLTARDFRLGAGAFLRWQRRVEMFGRVGAVLTAGHSWSEGGSEWSQLYEYKTPSEAMSFYTVTAGLTIAF